MNSFNRNAIDWFFSIMCTIWSCVYMNYSGRVHMIQCLQIFACLLCEQFGGISPECAINGRNHDESLYFSFAYSSLSLFRNLSVSFTLRSLLLFVIRSFIRSFKDKRFIVSIRFDSIWNIDTAKKCCCPVKWGTNDLSNILWVFGTFGRVNYWSERHPHREVKFNEAIQRSYGLKTIDT